MSAERLSFVFIKLLAVSLVQGEAVIHWRVLHLHSFNVKALKLFVNNGICFGTLEIVVMQCLLDNIKTTCRNL